MHEGELTRTFAPERVGLHGKGESAAPGDDGWEDGYPHEGLIEADLTGFVWTLNDRRVLDAVYERTKGFPFQLRGRMSEDFFFCGKAREAGFQLHVLGNVVVGHLGEVLIGRSHRLPFIEW